MFLSLTCNRPVNERNGENGRRIFSWQSHNERNLPDCVLSQRPIGCTENVMVLLLNSEGYAVKPMHWYTTATELQTINKLKIKIIGRYCKIKNATRVVILVHDPQCWPVLWSYQVSLKYLKDFWDMVLKQKFHTYQVI